MPRGSVIVSSIPGSIVREAGDQVRVVPAVRCTGPSPGGSAIGADIFFRRHSIGGIVISRDVADAGIAAEVNAPSVVVSAVVQPAFASVRIALLSASYVVSVSLTTTSLATLPASAQSNSGVPLLFTAPPSVMYCAIVRPTPS